ncbi:cardiolipin synthase [Acidisoma sp.]|uniref:cardiolipin synthase n=1 Tax=Acidisoma sp. TaxID=1872115 RepID=UPI003B00D2D6
MDELLQFLTRVRPDIELSVGLLIALIVTVHVLQTKREVAAATAWIGLAWFAPFFGGFAYFVLGVNRVRRRARRVRAPSARQGKSILRRRELAEEDNHLAALRHGVGRITGRQTEPGNSIRTLSNGDEAYPEMLAAIEEARHTIGLSSYIMKDDEIGGRFVDALQAAKQRGVEVRVIVDGIGSGWLRSPVYTRLRAAGVPAGRFMHSYMPWRMPFLNLRTHKKILVVDGRIGFTGGINIADQNVVATRPKDPVQDTHFRIEGPIVGQLVFAFARDWAFVADEELDGEAWYPALAAQGDSLARVVTAGPDEDLEKVEFAVLQAIACARDRIMIMTPYFLPDERLTTALSLAAMRGVDVQVVIPQKGNHRLLDWAVRGNIGPMLKDGVKVWLCPPPFRHSKVMIVDSEWSLIGSSNWDMRSFRLNFELCVEIYDPELSVALEALVEGNKSSRLELSDINARNIVIRMRDAGARLLLPYL